MIDFLSKVRKGLHFFLRLQGIVFFGGYPYPEREKDGYFLRVRAIDDLFSDRYRIYIDDYSLPDRQVLFEKVAHQTYVIRSGGSLKHSILSKILMVLCILKCRTVYFHSVYQINRSRKLIFFTGIMKILDVHGVVPEELGYINDDQNKAHFNKIEYHAVTRSNILIVVSEQMRKHLQKKYQGEIKGEFILLPIISELNESYQEKPLKNEKEVLIYAGGLQKWQQVPKMIHAMVANQNHIEFRFFCPEPYELQQMLPPQLKNSKALIIGSKSNEEILAEYQESHFGFILREDNIVNQVACPTKLIEYIALGVIPIVESANIGDFNSLGMRSIHIDDFLRGELPDRSEQNEMRDANRKVYQSLKRTYEDGKNQLRNRIPIKQRTLLSLKDETDPIPEPCDILIQVGDFLTGGLENVVLGINETLISEGYKLGLLILGACGPAVKSARASGVSVYTRKFEPHSYKRLLEALSPKLLLTHYSTEGAKICHGLGIPFVQVIHSIYLWFNETQLKAFQNSICYTHTFIAVSQYSKTYSVKQLSVPEDKCIVIPNGINVQRIREIDHSAKRKSLRKNFHFTEDDFVFLSVTAINQLKNILGMVKGFQKALEYCPHAKLALIGPIFSEDIFNKFRSIIKGFGLNHKIFYLGEKEEALNYYPMADAFIHTAFFEGGPLVLLEALAFNLPIVSTNVGLANHFKNTNGVNLISPPVDIFKYAGTIDSLKSNTSFEEALAKSIQSTYHNPVKPNLSPNIIDKMDIQVVNQNYLQLIEHVLAKDESSTADFMPDLWTDHI